MPINQAIIPSTVSTILALEVIFASRYAAARPFYYAAPDNGYVVLNNPTYANLLHFEGGNQLFCDGHVKWRKQSEIPCTDYGVTAFSSSGVNVTYWSLANS